MISNKYSGKDGELLEVTTIHKANHDSLRKLQNSELSLLWLLEDAVIEVDSNRLSLARNDVLCLTEFHRLGQIELSEAKLLRWNKSFYCVLDHDGEVGCRGILFYGAARTPVIRPNEEEAAKIALVWKILEQEMRASDNLQQDMLQMLLTRTLILCTRIFKSQGDYQDLDTTQLDLIRDYNLLVEQHFYEKHTVAEYAELLNKSPKTLSNLFKKMSDKTPLQFIQDRKMLEARRLLHHSDKTISEIGYELGFTDVQAFSRFFKKQEGTSPIDFRK